MKNLIEKWGFVVGGITSRNLVNKCQLWSLVMRLMSASFAERDDTGGAESYLKIC